MHLPFSRLLIGIATGLIASTFFGMVASTAASPATSPAWGVQVPLAFPSGGTTTLNDVDCVGSLCTAVGFVDDGVSTSALVASDSSGTWVMNTLPTTLGGTDAQLTSVSCRSSGCTAVGSFDNGSAIEAFAASNATGSWVETAIPTSLLGTPDAWLNGVSCYSSGCTAVGYSSDGSSFNSFMATNTSGSWVESALVRAANGSDGDQLTSVSCSDSDCVAVGTLTATDPSTYAVTTQAFWASSSNAWLEEPLSTVSPELNAQLSSVSCTTSGCIAVGSANDGNAIDTQSLIASESAGTWTEQVVPNQQDGAVNTSLSSVQCDEQSCEAVGSYFESAQQLPFSLNNVSGSWTSAVVPVDSVGSDAGLNGVACTSSATCVAVGAVVTGGDQVELIALSAPTLHFTQVPSQSAGVGEPYSSQLVASGGIGPTTYRVTSGSLPAGVVLETSTGQLVGTPTTPGSSNFVVTASNDGPPSQTAEITATITVSAPTPSMIHLVSLAATGANLRILVAGALLMLALGAVGLRARQRRRVSR